MSGENLIRCTIWLSMSAYAGFLLVSVQSRICSWSVRRVIWTFSWCMFLAHFVAAFHFYHGWSHAHAVADTAAKTADLMGWSFGEGIYFSYVFLVVWLWDVLWMWWDAVGYQNRGPAIRWAVHGYLFFIAINGTAVFESGATRWATIVCCVMLVIAVVTRPTARKPESSDTQHVN